MGSDVPGLAGHVSFTPSGDVMNIRELPPYLEAVLANWLPLQPWFDGRSGRIVATNIASITPIADRRWRNGPYVAILTVEVSFVGDGPSHLYQVPVSVRAIAQPALRGAILASTPGRVLYDGVRDPEAVSALLDLVASGARRNHLRFAPGPDGPPSERAWRSRDAIRMHDDPATGTSVIIGDRYVFKVFRRLGHWSNSDLALRRALRRSGNRHVPRLMGSIVGGGAGNQAYGLVQELDSSAPDGRDVARRHLEMELAAQSSSKARGSQQGSIFYHLGRATAAVHQDLAASGVAHLALSTLATSMRERLDGVENDVPELSQYGARVRRTYARLAALDSTTEVQLVHNNLSLCRTIFSARTWQFVDFEGDHAMPAAEARSFSSPLRDIAAMLRSLSSIADDRRGVRRPAASEAAVSTWLTGSGTALCRGYATLSGVDPRHLRLLLRAYELDRTVYEIGHAYGTGWHSPHIPGHLIRQLTKRQP